MWKKARWCHHLDTTMQCSKVSKTVCSKVAVRVRVCLRRADFSLQIVVASAGVVEAVEVATFWSCEAVRRVIIAYSVSGIFAASIDDTETDSNDKDGADDSNSGDDVRRPAELARTLRIGYHVVLRRLCVRTRATSEPISALYSIECLTFWVLTHTVAKLVLL